MAREHLRHDLLVAGVALRHHAHAVARAHLDVGRHVGVVAADDAARRGVVLGTGHLGPVIEDRDLEVDGGKRARERPPHVPAAKDEGALGGCELLHVAPSLVGGQRRRATRGGILALERRRRRVALPANHQPPAAARVERGQRVLEHREVVRAKPADPHELRAPADHTRRRAVERHHARAAVGDAVGREALHLVLRRAATHRAQARPVREGDHARARRPRHRPRAREHHALRKGTPGAQLLGSAAQKLDSLHG